MAITPRWGGLRPEPYNSNAADADNDGIVQEGTAFERPAGTRLLDSLGNELADGLGSTDRDTNWSVVDRSGNSVAYVPSYGGAFEPDRIRPLSDSPGTIQARVGTVRDRVGTIGDSSQTLESSIGTIISPPTTKKPEVSQEPPKIAQTIENKNKQVIDSLIQSGGTWGRISDDYVAENATPSSLFSPISTERKSDIRERRTRQVIADLRELLGGGTPTRESTGRTPEATEHNLQFISPEVRRLIQESTDEELIAILEEQSVAFHQSIDKRPRVRIPTGERLFKVLDEGYKTTHEVNSDHSDAGIRTQYENIMGIPKSAGASVRPASGYMVHPDWESQHRAKIAEETGREVTRFTDDVSSIDSAAGDVQIYGNIEVILKPEVSGRTKYGRGDSLNTELIPSAVNETDQDLITNAVLSNSGKESRALVQTVSNLLQTKVDGNFGSLNTTRRYGPSSNGQVRRGDYYEALIFGSFDSSDIEEMRIAFEDLEALSGTIRAREVDNFDPLKGTKDQTDKLLNQELRSEFLSPEFIESLGLDVDELDHLRELIGAEVPDGSMRESRWVGIPHVISDALAARGRVSLIDFRNADRAKKEIEARGIKVTPLHYSGLNVFDISSYGDAGDLTNIEQVLMRRTRDTIVKNVRESLRKKLGSQTSGGGSMV